MKIIDMHADTLLRVQQDNGKSNLYENNFMLDLKRLKKSDVMIQFFSIFMPPEEENRELFDKIYQVYISEIEKNNDIIAPLLTYADIQKNQNQNKISSLLTLEGAMVIEGEMEYLKKLFYLGIRLITLTWNYETCMAYPNSDDKSIMQRGLKKFGFEAIEMMNELGIIVDVSHLSDGGFWDVVRVSKKPFVASHSNSRTLTPHKRNLTDDMLKALADCGGVTGINFAAHFLELSDFKNPVSKVEYMVEHIKHIVKVAGIDTVALGSDFDGIKGKMELEHVGQMDKLLIALKKAGFTSNQLEKIFYKNSLRVIKETIY